MAQLLVILGTILAALILKAMSGGAMPMPAGVRIPKNFQLYRPLADKWLNFYAVAPDNFKYFYALVHQESGWDPTAFRAEPHLAYGEGISESYGLGQILLSTAYGLGFRGVNFDLYDPDTNLNYSVKLFSQLLKRFGNVQDALSAYNSGRPLSRAPESTKTVYVPRVLTMGAGSYATA